jgi:hypothetical protein
MDTQGQRRRAARLISPLIFGLGLLALTGCQPGGLSEDQTLSEQETAALLQSLPPLPAASGPAKTDTTADTPAPPTGPTAEPAFHRPNDLTPDENPSAPHLVRYAPEGDVERAELVSLTFSEPMVPLTRLEQTLEKGIPLTMTPEVEGQWRWLDTQSLVFEPTGDALPMATDYTVTLEEGFTSAAGVPMATTARWQFATAPLAVTDFYPGENAVTGEQPVLVLIFNQAIDKNQLLEHVSLKDKQHTHALKRVDPDTLAQDEYKALIDDVPAEQWLALTPSEPLPWNQTFSLTLAQGTPAKAGNRLTKADQAFSFRTAGPFRIERNDCAERECTPDEGVSLQFSHRLSEDWDKSRLEVSPDVDGLEISHYGTYIQLRGSFQPETEYTLTLPAGTTDEFGRALEEDLVTKVTIASYPPMFTLPGQDLITLPGAFATLPIVSRNIQTLDIEVRQVTPDDWSAFQRYRLNYRRAVDKEKPEKPGTLLENHTLTLDAEANTMTVTRLSLDSWLNEEGFGHLLVFASSPEMDNKDNGRYRYNQAQSGQWLQVTNLGVSTYAERDRVTAWVTDLTTGTPIADARVHVGAISASTDDNGLASLPLSDREDHSSLMVESQSDQALFQAHSLSPLYRDEYNYYRYPTFTFTDRQLYQPGETVHLKGLIRERGFGVEGDLHYPEDLTHLEWTAYDGQRNELDQGRLPLSESGAFDLSLPLPSSAASGSAGIELRLFRGDKAVDHFYGGHSFLIETFRRPEYKVDLNFSTERPIAQAPLQATARASYYAGGPLPNAPVDWQLTLNTARYAPPGWSDYHFGRVPPMWGHGFWPQPEEARWQHQASGQTNTEGEHRLSIAPNKALDFSDLLFPHTLDVTTTVTDVNRQQWSTNDTLFVHPGNLYVGLRTEKRFAHIEDTITAQWVTVDIDGNAVTTDAPDIEVERLAWEDGDWQTQDTLNCTPSDKKQTCEFSPADSGQYRISATVTDAKDRPNRSQIHLWVAGPLNDIGPTYEEQPRVQLIPDQDEYAPGDSANVQIQTPFTEAHTLVTVQRQGLVEVDYHYLEDGTHTLEVPIKDNYLPQLVVTAEAIGGTPAEGQSLPQIAVGELTLPVSNTHRQLSVEVTPSAEAFKPGDPVEVSTRVTGPQGAPAADAEVTFYAVDQAVLDMAGYTLPDPLTEMYSAAINGVFEYRSRAEIPLVPKDANDGLVEEVMVSGVRAIEMSMAVDRGPGESANPTVTLRQNFSALATFESRVTLDSKGEANVSFTLPDNLTRYRIMAVAHTEQQFGAGDAQIDVGLPLMVRPSLPRFLNLGDRAELPVVVQNTTDQAMTVELALRASNLTLSGAPGRRLTIPANDRREVRFSAEPIQVGEARVQVIVRSGERLDAAEVAVPVQRPATDEAFAQYGSLTEGNKFLQIDVPDNVYPDFGGLSLTTSSTQFQSLQDAFLYLYDYPYGCAEQLASRLMAIASLNELLGTFNAEGLPDEAAIQQSVGDLLGRLEELQNRDGGWGFWMRNETSQAYLSVHVTHALLRAREAGYEVLARVLESALSYTRSVAQQLPKSMAEKPGNSVLAYSIYVQALAGDSVASAAIDHFRQTESELSLEAMGWLLSATANEPSAEPLHENILRRLTNQLRETAATASFVEDYAGGGHWVLHGSRRTDAVVLDALLSARPDSDLIEKLARGLVNHRRNGHWGNTQENVFVLLALKHYFQAREAEVPDLTARAWLGDRYLGEQSFQGRGGKPTRTGVSMSELQSGEPTTTLALQHEGQGRLYYRIGMEYAPADLQLDAARHGFQVARHYEAVNDPDDVTQADDGTWHIKAGAAVRVTLTLTVPARRHHVALTDRLPAGFEALNPALETSAPIRENERGIMGSRIRPGHWYNHQQLRDDRAEAFSTQLEPGVYHYEYTALATTPGEFVVPPAKAEEMYQPETFGRSATETVRVVETP